MNEFTVTAIQTALRGLSARQRAQADNVANLETPGYQAKRVDFEQSLREALAAGSPGATDITLSTSGAPSNLNGNNVSVEDETMGMIETNLRYRTAARAMSFEFEQLRASIKGA